jgi:hypothetical protein
MEASVVRGFGAQCPDMDRAGSAIGGVHRAYPFALDGVRLRRARELRNAFTICLLVSSSRLYRGFS